MVSWGLVEVKYVHGFCLITILRFCDKCEHCMADSVLVYYARGLGFESSKKYIYAHVSSEKRPSEIFIVQKHLSKNPPFETGIKNCRFYMLMAIECHVSCSFGSWAQPRTTTTVAAVIARRGSSPFAATNRRRNRRHRARYLIYHIRYTRNLYINLGIYINLRE